MLAFNMISCSGLQTFLNYFTPHEKVICTFELPKTLWRLKFETLNYDGRRIDFNKKSSWPFQFFLLKINLNPLFDSQFIHCMDKLNNILRT